MDCVVKLEELSPEKLWQIQLKIRINQIKCFKVQYKKLMTTLLNPEKYT